MYSEADPGNCAVTDEMRAFKPVEDVLQFGSSAPQRLIYYPQDGAFLPSETEALKKFKEHCKSNNVPVPEVDNEILRVLHKNYMDVTTAYDNIVSTIKLKNELFPLKFTQRTHDLVMSGQSYIGGRDRHYRPYFVVRPDIMNRHTPTPTPEEALGASMIMFLFA